MDARATGSSLREMLPYPSTLVGYPTPLLSSVHRLYRRWGIKTLREYADQDRRPPPRRRQPGRANMPGHADDDARFYDRQQLMYTLAGDSSD